MKQIRQTVIFFIFILILASTFHPIIAEENPKPTLPKGFLDKIAALTFMDFPYLMGITPWYVLRFSEPDQFIAIPKIIYIWFSYYFRVQHFLYK